MFTLYRTHKKDQLQNQQSRYDALKIQVRLEKDTYIMQTKIEPNIVYLQKVDADFAIQYNEMLEALEIPIEDSVDMFDGMKIEVGSKISVKDSRWEDFQMMLSCRRYSC